MHDQTAAEGEVLLDINARGIALSIVIFGIVLAAAGIVAAILGFYLGLITPVPLPFMVWYSRSIAGERLVFTTKGVRYERGRGTPALDDFVAWPSIEKVEYVVKRKRFSDGTMWFHFLVFDHGGPTPLRYQFGSGPKAELLKEVARICREHDVAVRSFPPSRSSS